MARNQIEITPRTGLLLSTNERLGVSYHIIHVGLLACLQVVGHYVACFAWLCWLGLSAQTRYHVPQVPGLILIAVGYRLNTCFWQYVFYTNTNVPGTRFWQRFVNHSMDTQQRLRIPSLYLRRGKNSVQEMGKNVAKWVPQIWYHHPHHLGTDVTFFFPRPQHVKKTIHNTVRNIPSLHSNFFFAFRVVVDVFVCTWCSCLPVCLLLIVISCGLQMIYFAHTC